MPGLFLCQVFVGDFLDYYYSEVSVEVMVVCSKMAVDPQGICSMDIISVLIYPLVCSLFLHFSDILFPVTFHTECQIDRIFGPAIGPVPYLKSFSIRAGKEVSCYYVSAAEAVGSSHAGAATSTSFRLFSDHPVSGYPCLPN